MKRTTVKILVKLSDDKIVKKQIFGYILDYDNNLAIHRDYSRDKYWAITDLKSGLLLFSKFGFMNSIANEFKTHTARNKYLKVKQSPVYKKAIDTFNKAPMEG